MIKKSKPRKLDINLLPDPPRFEDIKCEENYIRNYFENKYTQFIFYLAYLIFLTTTFPNLIQKYYDSFVAGLHYFYFKLQSFAEKRRLITKLINSRSAELNRILAISFMILTLYFFVSGIGTHTYKVYGLTCGYDINCSPGINTDYVKLEVLSRGLLSIINEVPIINNTLIYPTSANTTVNLECNTSVLDAENLSFSVEYWWYNSSDLIATANVSEVQNNTNTLINTLSYTNTGWNETWNCTIRAFDGGNYSLFGNATIRIGDSTPPTCTFSSITETLTEGYQHVVGSTVYYNNYSTGQFTVTASASDEESGAWNITFPTTVSAGAADYSAPYQRTYAWDNTDNYDSESTITCYDAEGNSDTTTFTITLDDTPPSGGSVSYTDGYSTDNTITFSDGTDSESGVNYSRARLFKGTASIGDDNSCGSFSWAQVGSDDPTSPYTDEVVHPNCYMYRYEVYDNVSNVFNYTLPTTVLINNSVPTHNNPTLTPSDPQLSEDITCNWQSVSDSDSDPVVNITNWYKNNHSLTVLYLPFEGVSGNVSTNVTDYSSYNNDGTVFGATFNRTGGQVGGAYNFDATDYIEVPGTDDIDGYSEISVEAWVQRSSAKTHTIINKLNIFKLQILATNIVRWSIVNSSGLATGTNNADTEKTIAQDTWTHIVGTYNGSLMKVYVDGELNLSQAASGLLDDNAQELYISYSSNAMEGYIDEVKIYNFSLSSDQILKNYQAGAAGRSSNVLSYNETSNDEDWHCEVTPNDGFEDGIPKNSTLESITNSPPAKPTLLHPDNGNETVHTRTPMFNWTTTDSDNDPLTYTINISFPSTAECGPDLSESAGSNDYYTPPIHLCVDQVINWTVRAYDGIEYSPWSDTWNFTVESYLSLSLTTDGINFGATDMLVSKDTESGYNPLILENTGNILINIARIGANASLFEEVGLNTSYFQFKADNDSTESWSFDWGSSTTDWTNMTNVSVFNNSVVASLDYNDTHDNAEIDIRIEVPQNERPSAKKATIYIIGEQS